MLSTLALIAALLPVPAAAASSAGAAGPTAARGKAEPLQAAAPAQHEFVSIPAGEYVPLYGDGSAVAIAAFELDRYPVTQRDFQRFVLTQPQWQRDSINAVFADGGYLRGWLAPLEPAYPAAPVVDVSWFAARAYCGSIGGRLPTVDEWEYVAAASETQRDASRDEQFRALVLELFTRARPQRLPAADSGVRNWYGIHGQHGIVREWVADFNNVMVSDDSRGTGGDDRQLYCAAASSNARDTSDYAAFLRYSFRAGLNGRSTHGNLGFRCARSTS